MSHRHVCIADELDLSACQNSTPESPCREQCGKCQESDLQPELPRRVACEKVLSLQNVGGNKQYEKYERAAQVNGLGSGQAFQFVAKALSGLTHDAVGETGCGTDGTAQRGP